MNLSPDDTQSLAVAIAKALQQSRSVSDSEHFDHHVWITGQIEKDKRRAKFWEEMTTHVAKFGAWSIITGSVYAMWLGFKDLLHK